MNSASDLFNGLGLGWSMRARKLAFLVIARHPPTKRIQIAVRLRRRSGELHEVTSRARRGPTDPCRDRRKSIIRGLTRAFPKGKFHGYITAPKDLGDQFVPNLASAKKNMRKSRAAAIRNRAQKSALRTALKRASAGGNAEEKLEAVKLLDRASRKGLIHKNAAARHK